MALGQTMTVTLASQSQALVVNLPLAALMHDGQGPAVWRLMGPGWNAWPSHRGGADSQSGTGARRFGNGDRVVSLGAR